MKTKMVQTVPVLLAVAGLAYGQGSYWCMYSNGSCYGTWLSHIYQYFTNPLYNFSLHLLPLTAILVFVPRSIFISWLKLAAWMLPLSFFYIATTGVTSSQGFGMNLFPFYRDDAARLAALVFDAASALLIVWKYFATRHSKN
ncbi:MAG: hypothetical protein ACYCZZ_02095 [Minisyncoccota bacterium]